MKYALGYLLPVFALTLQPSVRAADLQASLDEYKTTIPADRSTALHASLYNASAHTLYFTGINVALSDGASGNVFEPQLLQEKLNRLEAGHRWDGPLVMVKPNHRGPLLVKGDILVKGGSHPTDSDLLASIPVHLTINDPRRQLDGSYDREAVPVCNRDADACCDPLELLCEQVEKRCIYVADGYNRQQVCVNAQADKAYEHVSELHISSDGLHMAYLGFSHCLMGGDEERCQRTLVFDHVEQPTLAVPTHLALSPDGLHYAYIGRKQCVTHSGQEVCTGPATRILDGAKATQWPSWYPVKPPKTD